MISMIQTEPLIKESKVFNDPEAVKKKRHQCPKCKVELYSRVHRGVLIKALFPNSVKRYFCYSCLHKYYVIG